MSATTFPRTEHYTRKRCTALILEKESFAINKADESEQKILNKFLYNVTLVIYCSRVFSCVTDAEIYRCTTAHINITSFLLLVRKSKEC
jgi:hypothetical protein